MEFTSSVQDIDPVTKKIQVSIPAETVAKEIDTAVARVSRTARIKGFREGKAPRAVVERMYGERIRAEVHNDLISTAINDAAKKHEISIVGSPQVNLAKLEVGKPFEFAADVSVYPQPEVSGYETFEISVPKREVTDAEVTNVIDYLRKNRATVKPLEGRTTLQRGDVAQGEFVVMEEGGEEGKPEPYSFGLGDAQLPKEVEDAYEGMAIGETRSATVESKQEGAEAAKKIVYRCTLKGLSERILPELDDTFAKQVEPGVASVLELRLKISESLKGEKDREHRSDVNAAIIKKLTEANQFAIPQVLADDEIRGILVNRGFIDPSRMDVNALPMDVFRKELGEAALQRVRAAIIIDRIAEKEGLKVEKEDIENAVKNEAQARGISPQEAQRRVFEKDRAVQSMVEIVRNKTLDMLRQRAKITFSESTAGDQGSGAQK